MYFLHIYSKPPCLQLNPEYMLLHNAVCLLYVLHDAAVLRLHVHVLQQLGEHLSQVARVAQSREFGSFLMPGNPAVLLECCFLPWHAAMHCRAG
jgi:hypothetical protein